MKSGNVLFLVLCILIGFFVAVGTDKLLFNQNNKAPTTIIKTNTKIDTLKITFPVHDTITKYVKKIKNITDTLILMPEETPRIDSATMPLSDSKNCYSFRETYSDGARIGAEVCSKEFPEKEPKDITKLISYLPPSPDTVKDSTFIYKNHNPPLWISLLATTILGITLGTLIW